MKGADEDESEDEEEEDEDEEGEDEYEYREAKEPKGKARGAGIAAPQVESDSDEEDEDDEGEEDEEDRGVASEGWGPNKRSYYSTNDLEDLSSDSEMDEEERREMELREVKRLQAKSRQGMDDDDFGLAEVSQDRMRGTASSREQRRRDLDGAASDPVAPSKEEALPLDPAARSLLVARVQKTTPETIALAGEFADIVDDVSRNIETINEAMAKNPDDPSMGLMQLHHQTLLTYITTLAFYFHLRSSPAYASDPTKLQSHPVLERLMKLKKGLSVMEDYGFGAGSDGGEGGEEVGEEEEEEEDEDEGMDLDDIKAAPIAEGSDDGSVSLGSLEEDELSQLAAEEKENAIPKTKSKPPPPQVQKGKKQQLEKEGTVTRGAATYARPEKKEKKSKKGAKERAPPLAELADLGEDELVGDLAASLSSNKKKRGVKRTVSDEEAFDGLGEPTALSASDSLDKEARKKSLRFHTNQIDARDARRKQQLGGPSVGGDTDIPYRDRERSRLAVQQAAAKRAAKDGANADGLDLDGGDWGEADTRDWRDVMGVEGNAAGALSSKPDDDDDGGDGAADYYDLVVSGKRAAKKQKKEEHDAAKLALRDELMSEAAGEAGDHRGIDRAIEKNRGLTPRRNKASRNPRVKKRQKYDQAQKKLSSTRPVFKGGQNSLQGGYSGEASGISSNVVKSRRFA